MTVPQHVPTEDEALDQELRSGYFDLSQRVRDMPHRILDILFSCVWSRETAEPVHRGTWPGRHPSHGQDDVTALAVQTMRGGYIWWNLVEGHGRHCYNMASNGEGVSNEDRTRSQFAHDARVYVSPQHSIEREALLADEEVLERYRLIRGRLLEVIRKELGILTETPEGT